MASEEVQRRWRAVEDRMWPLLERFEDRVASNTISVVREFLDHKRDGPPAVLAEVRFGSRGRAARTVRLRVLADG